MNSNKAEIDNENHPIMLKKQKKEKREKIEK
jgi:hypothetical protein